MSTTSRPASTEKPFHHGSLQRAALDAAWGIVSDAGPNALSLRDVAKRQGVTHRALYRHFADKADLELAVVAEGFSRLAAAMQQSLAGDAGKTEPKLAVVEAYVRFALAHAGPYRLMFSQKASALMAHAGTSAAVNAVIKVALEAFGQPDLVGNQRLSTRDEVMRAWAQAHGLVDLWFGGILRARNADEAEAYIVRQLRTQLA